MKQKIYLYGDSIGQGVIWDEARGRYRLAPARCVRVLEQAGVPVENHARMGMTARKGLELFLAEPPAEEGLLVIEFGGNDCDLDWNALQCAPEEPLPAKTPLHEFETLLDAFVREGRLRGHTPVLVTPPPLHCRRYFDWVCRGRNAAALLRGIGDVEHIYRWEERYARAVTKAARRNVCPCLDLREPFLDSSRFPELICADGIHPTGEGQELMARTALQALARAGLLTDGEPAWPGARGWCA